MHFFNYLMHFFKLFNVFFINIESNNKHFFLEKNLCEIKFSEVVVILIEQKKIYLRFWVGELIFHLDLKTCQCRKFFL